MISFRRSDTFTTKEIKRRDVERAELFWRDAFDAALHSLLDYEMGQPACVKAVQSAAMVADEALAQFEERWPR